MSAGERSAGLAAAMEDLLRCPICMDTVQLPVGLVCFRGCPGTRKQGAHAGGVTHARSMVACCAIGAAANAASVARA